MKNKTTPIVLLFGLIVFLLVNPAFSQIKGDTIKPMEVWPDNNGNHIQAHGGGIIKVKNIYYWYGEERAKGLDTNFKYVSCYESADLTHWKFNGDIKFKNPYPDSLHKWILERPKVYYNAKAKKYVLYFHLDGGAKDAAGKYHSGYYFAEVGVAVSDNPAGPYQFVHSFRPLGHESRDIGQFIDDDGTPYLVFEDRPFGFRIASLSADYLSVDKEICLIPAHMEGGAIVHYNGLYYAIGSALTGWDANPNKYATAPSLAGPWTEFKDIAPPEVKTYGSQSTMMIKVTGTKKTTVIFMGDIWKPRTQWDSRYLWMPVEIGDGKLWLPKPAPWKLNVKTGEAVILEK